ncbi:MAG: NADH-quinone oxidoreductase subunit L [Phycisphaerae bacterium]|nr:NADH-quinone oxidoreductase subunit L [Phycisphaerae bacterium]
MFFSILFFPFLGSLFAGFFGRFVGRKGSVFLSTFSIFISCFFSWFFFISSFYSPISFHFVLFPWMSVSSLFIYWGFLFDSLTYVILIVVTSVSLLVHLYSSSYIENDPHLPRFISYLSLFTFFMLILITADNFIQMFVGWEGVGLCSFLLINFWFTRIQANKAAIKAIFINRIGDYGLALGIFALYLAVGSVDYAIVFSYVPFLVQNSFYFFIFNFDIVSCVSLLIFIGAVGKSAQLSLHTWLPDAIEGPTPVSALIHAATIVTAGVFLLARSSPFIEYSSFILNVITFFGASTALFAATTGLLQNDLKKVIAYSTCSQLGYIVFACGVSAYHVGVFHLANHAFFKALLFLCAGSVIHAIGDEQDMRKIGGLAKLLPFTYSSIVIGSLALGGFPFLSGFYSKDIILENAYGAFSSAGHFSFFIGSVAAFCTSFYSIRLLYLTFLSPANGFKKRFENIHESSFAISFPLVCLAFGSIFFGFFIKDSFIGLGSSFFNQSIFIAPFHLNSFSGEFLPSHIKLFPSFMAIFGMFSSFLLFNLFRSELVFFKLNPYLRFFYTFFNKKWFFDKFYVEIFGQSGLSFAFQHTYSLIDRGFFEIFGPFGISNSTQFFSISFSFLSSGHLYHYLFSILIFIFSFSFFILSPFSFSPIFFVLIFFMM